MDDLTNDIEKYLRGELSPAERHALEKKALNDPFLADALEGAESVSSEDFSADMLSMQSALQNRIQKADRKVIPLWITWTARIAAGFLLVAVSYFVIDTLKKDTAAKGNLAENHIQPETLPQTDTVKENVDSPAASGTITEELTSRDSYATKPSTFQKPTATEAPSVPESEEVLSDDRIAMSESPALSESKQESKRKMSRVKRSADSVYNIDQHTEQLIIAGNDGYTNSKDVVSSAQAWSYSVSDSVAVSKEVTRLVPVAATPAKGEMNDDDNSLSDQKFSKAKSSPGAASKIRTRLADGKKIITGKVTSAEDGNGLPGVNVLIKGTNLGTVTDGEGNFEVVADESSPTLQFTFIGMENQEVKIDDASSVNVAMNEDMTQLSEVVVVGYGTEKTEEESGNIEFATPEGGRSHFKNYIETSLRYPQLALDNNIEGKVTIQFTVETSGNLTDFKVIRGIGYGCDDEVIRLIKKGPKWSPTRKDAEPVVGKMRVRVKFRIPKK